ncbi:hypothetical protein QJS04_geneDACA018068 [Acorus gramineus]|uniref:Uncharacterized protein n=1 Tax=Acorus gramineus TaxID=55184 RepID=A0AAV9A900_ACOGR|nr:hypothetical protein QJS04_geneDACA018068 [Acorus gramineus]
MAVFRTLKTLIRTSNPKNHRPFFHFDRTLPSPSTAAAASSLQNPLSRSRPFSPFFQWRLPASVPARNFSQSAIRPFPRPRKNGLRSAVGWTEARQYSVVGGGDDNERFLNLPNLISIGRMVSGPFLGLVIVNEWYLSAFVGLAISGATDWLDGFVARRMGINSVIGSYLDPLADKVLIACVALAMVERDLLHPGLVGLVVLRDAVLVSGAFYKRASNLGWEWKNWSDFVNLDGTHPEKVEPLLISKINTVFQLLLVAAALLQPELGTHESQQYITYLSWLVASTTVASSVAYGAQYMRKISFSGGKIV